MFLNPDDQTTFMFQGGFYLGFLVGYTMDQSVRYYDGSTLDLKAGGNTFNMSYSDGTVDNATFQNGNPFKKLILVVCWALGCSIK